MTTASKLANVQLLSSKQVAQLLDVHPRTVWRLASAGDIPKPIRIGEKLTRWRLCDLEAWLAGKGESR